jgi:hypothetical protein
MPSSDDEPAGSDDVKVKGDTSGTFFNADSNTWMPVSSCSQRIIPEELPVDASVYVMKRATCSDVAHESGEPSLPRLSEDRFMIGVDCLPVIGNSLCNCGRAWVEATLQSCGTFILRTYLGAVIRTKKKAICACGSEKNWNPAIEYVHTIDDDCEGGMLLLSLNEFTHYFFQLMFMFNSVRCISHNNDLMSLSNTILCVSQSWIRSRV